MLNQRHPSKGIVLRGEGEARAARRAKGWCQGRRRRKGRHRRRRHNDHPHGRSRQFRDRRAREPRDRDNRAEPVEDAAGATHGQAPRHHEGEGGARVGRRPPILQRREEGYLPVVRKKSDIFFDARRKKAAKIWLKIWIVFDRRVEPAV